MMDPGSTVFWLDPDDGLCSGYAIVVDASGDSDIVMLQSSRGSEIAALRSEIIDVWNDEDGIWGDYRGLLLGPYDSEERAAQAFHTDIVNGNVRESEA